ncbi:MAG: hypothetical protein R3181_03715 [Rubricoccaceae bacterium]|nr:hypothetical protein [Rubricoccaceae bacterium]
MVLAPLPDAARLWLFAAARDLTGAEAAALVDRVRSFMAGWTSHGRPVASAAEVLEGRVLAVGAALSEAELNAGVSGCGIDKLQHAVEAAAEAGGFAWTGALDVLYRDADGAVQAVARSDFRRLARTGAVDASTPVLDLTLSTVGALRASGVERPAAQSWHARAFGLAKTASTGA